MNRLLGCLVSGMAALGVEVIASSPEQFAQHLKSEIEKWGKVVREAKIRVD